MPSRQTDRTSPQSVAEDLTANDLGAVRDDSSGSGASASLDQFRQVLEDQRRQTAQLQSLLESRFASDAGGGAADKVETLVSKIENLASRLDSIGNGGTGHASPDKAGLPPQVSGLMLRVGELERKITEATPEPLLKEIIFRLGSLEDAVGQSPDGGGIGEIRERVKALERQKPDRTAPDPRIDEFAARLASLENTPRAAPEARIDEVLARLHSLEDHAAESASTVRLEELQQQIELLHPMVESGNHDGLKAIEDRIAAIETAESTSNGATDEARLAGLDAKVEALAHLASRLELLESKVEEAAGREDVRTWAARLDSVESWGARLAVLEETAAASDPRIDDIATRLEKLDALDSVAERLNNVEEQSTAPPPDPRMDELESKVASLTVLLQRLDELEGKLAEPAADPRVDNVESRLNSIEQAIERVAALEAKAAEPAADPRVDEIKARLGAMADVAHIGDVESRVSSLTTRLDALKMITDGLKATHKPAGNTADPRVDALTAKMEELKAQIAAQSESACDAAPRAWEELQQRVETLETHGTPSAHDPRFTELASRLASLEKAGSAGSDPRVSEILARLNTMEQPNGAAVQAAVPSDLIARIDALEKRLSGAPAKGTDPIVAQLRERWEILEERMIRFEESMPGGGYGESGEASEELRNQVAALRERIEALSAGGTGDLDPETVATLRELARNPPASGGTFDLGAVKSQMTFVYFSIGMLYAICAYAGFVMLSSN